MVARTVSMQHNTIVRCAQLAGLSRRRATRGRAGMLILTGLGGLLGYRQAKSGHGLAPAELHDL
jgi:hypothetical protein